MAKRPRSHQLEDESIAAFLMRRPSRWVARQKTSDYGIDLEVEIFDVNEISTGAIFFVQLKATDDLNGRKLILDREYLMDLCRYRSSSIVARYFARDKTLFWAWSADLLAQIPEGQASKTFHFRPEDQLDDRAFEDIETAILLGELFENLPPEQPLPICLEFGDIGGRRRLEIRSVLGRLDKSSIHAVEWLERQSDKLLQNVKVSFSSDAITAAFGPRYSVRFEVDNDLPSEEIGSRILYGIATLFSVSGLTAHGAILARSLLQLQIRSESRALGVTAVKLLSADPRAYVDLAILNKIHVMQDFAYIDTLFGLYELSGSRADISTHSLRFLDAALESAGAHGPDAEAAVLYSMANAARRVDISLALSLYIKAKRKKNVYMQTQYFLREVAGCLFHLGRFRCAASAYIRSGMDSHSNLDNLLLADCFLFSGNYDNARIALGSMTEETDAILTAERDLKVWLTEALSELKIYPVPTRQLYMLFNGAVKSSREGDFAAALPRFLLCCLMVQNDHESWLNALICALNANNIKLATVVAAVGLSLEGEDLLDFLSASLAEKGVDDHIHDFLADTFFSISGVGRGEARELKRLTQKLSHFDAAIPIDQASPVFP